MTTKTNFTTNPDHPDLELHICWDTDEARWSFDENFKRVDGKEHLFLYTDCGNLPDETPTPVIIPKEKNTKNNLAKALDELEGAWPGYDTYLGSVKEYSLPELVQELTDHASFDDEEYFDTLDRYNIKYTIPYEILATQGYNQGDYAEVIIPTEAIKEAWGSDPTEAGLRATINDLFWSTPLYFNLVIDDEDYFSSEFWPDSYEYDKNDFIQAFMSKYRHTLPDPEYIEEWLEENLPVDPEYLY